MPKKEFWLVAAIALVAGFVGGLLSGGTLRTEAAIASDVPPSKLPPGSSSTPPTPPMPPAVQGSTFTLYDGQLRTRAYLSMGLGGPQLKMLDANGKLRLSLGVNDTVGPYLQYFDSEQKGHLTLGASGTSMPGLYLTGSDAGRGVNLGPTIPDGKMSLRIWSDGKAQTIAP